MRRVLPTILSSSLWLAPWAGSTLLIASGAAAQQPPADPAPAASPPVVSSPPAPMTPVQDDSTSLLEKLSASLGRPGGLTSDEVARRAAETSFTVAARRAEVAAAAADVDRALYAYFPHLGVGARYTRLSDVGASDLGTIVVAPDTPAGGDASGTRLVSVPLVFPILLNEYAFAASLSVPISDYFTRIHATLESTEHAHAASRANLATTLRQTQSDARVGYYAWVRSRLQVLVTEQALAQNQAHLEDVRNALGIGSTSQADVLRVESQEASAELLLATAQNLAIVTEKQIRVAMHDGGSAPYAIGEDVRTGLPELTVTDNDELAQRAFSRRPEAESLRQSAAARRREAAATRAAYLPRLDLAANGTVANPNPRVFPPQDEFKSSWDVSAQVSWALGDIPAAVASQRGSEARAAQLDAQGRAVADQIQVEVTQAVHDVARADLAVSTTARGLASAEESYRVRRLLFQNGRATSTELLDAETDLTRTRLEALDARIDARVARVRLSYALGDDLGSPAPQPKR
jgi:outer membrane protein